MMSEKIVLAFSGGAELRFAVECIEARLVDTGAAWQAQSRPRHDLAAGDRAASSPGTGPDDRQET